MNELIKANIAVLDQLIQFTNSCNDDTYTCALECSPSSIGKHIRHILDHYHCVQQGYLSEVINYNNRQRGSAIEHNSNSALKTAQVYQRWLLNFKGMNSKVSVISDTQFGQSTTTPTASTLERELLYLINHSVHHLAYAALLAKIQGLSVPEGIGVAPSTHNFNCKNQETRYEIS